MPTEFMFADRRGMLDCRPAPICDPRPVCPACGGLECFCRPRFFAGQLLSEEDLNRLDHYIVGKNRLHNRHLFGTGVVCGLEVVCNPCDPAGGGNVLVRTGYALSPCGNDIVVCKEESVNVCDLINRCRPRRDDCFEPGIDPEECQQGDEEWVLAICYQEKPSRGITALRGASCSCGPSCGCGAGCGCGCGGGAKHSQSSMAYASYGAEASCGCAGNSTAKPAKAKPAAKPGPSPSQCEPTLVCEGYNFAVYKISQKERRQRDYGALIRRFLCCLQPMIETWTKFPDQKATKEAHNEWLQSLIAMVREFLLGEGLYNCDLAAQLVAIQPPSQGQATETYVSEWSSAVLGVLQIVAAIFQKCMCAALLPPCPPPEMNDCVPIATLTVARGRCRVRRICNIANRRFLMTLPAIEYWLSWLPLFSTAWQQGHTFQDLIAEFCCKPIGERFNFLDLEGVSLHSAIEPGLAAPPAFVAGPAIGEGGTASFHPFTKLLADSLGGQAPKANAATLVLAALGARRADGAPLASQTALAHPGEAMLIDQILAPMMAPVMPLVGGARGGADTASFDALRTEVASLRNTVMAQQKAITKLQKG